MRAEKREHKIQWSRGRRLAQQTQRAQLVLQRQAVARLHLKRGHPTGQDLAVRASGLGEEHELRALRLLRESASATPLDLVFTFLGAHLVPAGAASAEAYAETVRTQMLPAVIEQGIAEFQDLVCEKGVFEPPVAARLLAESRRLGLPAR